ncbi:MAG TPA: hypothetical protein VGL27_16095 [Negativicutes bacterium]
MEAKAELTKDEVYTRLNYFLGFGDLRETDILFFGIEEGAGPNQPNEFHQHRAEVLLRTQYAWENQSETEFLIGRDPSNGFWVTGNYFSKARKQCYEDQGYIFRPDKEKSVWQMPTLSYTARILAAMTEENPLEMKKWFKYKNPSKDQAGNKTIELLDQEQIVQIERRFFDGMYGKPPIKIFQTDWRPIPRRSTARTENGEEYWPYTDDINLVEYFKAFNFEPAEDYYIKLREARLAIYRTVFNTYHIPIVYSYGGQGMMIPLLANIIECITGKSPTIFESTIPAGRNKKVRWMEAEFSKGRTTFIFTDHFSGGGGINLPELEVVSRQLRRLIDRKEIDLKGLLYQLPKKRQRTKIDSIKTGSKLTKPTRVSVQAKQETTGEQARLVTSNISELIAPGQKGVTNMQMIPVVKKALDSDDYEKLRILKASYPSVFDSTRKYIGDKRKLKLEGLKL